MRQRQFSNTAAELFSLGVLALALASSASAQHNSNLYAFKFFNNGRSAYGSVTLDSAGNIYGTTASGGLKNCHHGCGVVFQLKRKPTGGYSYSVLYQFKGGMDGANPYAGLVLDAGGNLYGAAAGGGNNSPSCHVINTYMPGCGNIFKLTQNSDGTWTQSVLYIFTGGADGANPYAGLIFSAAGDLYGTASAGGDMDCSLAINYTAGCGTAFKLGHNSDGTWTQSVIHMFQFDDGAGLFAGLVFDSTGNLYGTSVNGGTNGTCTQGCGVIFEMTPNSGGNWTQTVLHNFAGRPDGGNPYAGLTLDSASSLYGTTSYGGKSGAGTAFKLAGSTFKVIHDFHLTSGATPEGGMVFDSTGNLYGTTFLGGYTAGVCNFDVPLPGCGVVFKLTPGSTGSWTYNVVKTFKGVPGGRPYAGLTLDGSGNIYGTTTGYATSNMNFGTVFRITP